MLFMLLAPLLLAYAAAAHNSDSNPLASTRFGAPAYHGGSDYLLDCTFGRCGGNFMLGGLLCNLPFLRVNAVLTRLVSPTVTYVY